jgi:uncharacterized membrane protein YjfL (UPF0719 family)
MADLFQPVIQKLIDLGFYNFFFPFLIAAALFFGLLKKSKLFGDSVVINAVVSLSLAFMIMGFPVIWGQPGFFALPLSAFFAQGTVILLIFMLAFIGASFFYPDMTKWILEVFKHRTMLTIMIAVAFGLLFTSGLIQVLFIGISPPSSGGAGGQQTAGKTPFDVIIIVAGIIIFVIMIIIAASVVRGTG